MGRLADLAAAVGGATLAGLIGYAAWNRSGHTGLDPYCALAIFIPVLLIGVMAGLGGDRAGARPGAGLVAIIVGLAGIVLLVWLDHSNTLLPYEKWLARGLP